MTREQTIECYLMNSNKVNCEILYDTITKYEALTSCDGCDNKPEDGGNYPMICGQCKRFYGDLFNYDKEEYE